MAYQFMKGTPKGWRQAPLLQPVLGTDDTDTQAYVIFLRDPALLSNSPPQYQTVSD